MKNVNLILIMALSVLVVGLVACRQTSPTPPSTATKPIVATTDGTSSVEEPLSGGTLVAAVAEDLQGLDPHPPKAVSTFRILGLLYDPLFTYDEDMRLVGNLAESWEFSEDAMSLRVNLRPNIVFHDGTILTSEDVKASFERILNEETGSSLHSSLSSIESIETPEDRTITFQLNTPHVALPDIMATVGASIMSKDWLESGHDPAREVNGTGPFKLANWETDQVIELERHDEFWIPGLPYLDAIEVRVIPDEASILAALRAQEVDFAVIDDPRVAIQARNESDLEMWNAPDLTFHALQLNADREVFSNKLVRQAVSCAINRQEVLDTASLGEGSVTAPAPFPFYAAPLDTLFCYDGDADTVRELLAEANVSDLSFTAIATTGETPVAVNQAQNIQAQLAEAGIEMEIEVLELQTYIDRWLESDFDAAIARHGGTNPDGLFYRYWHSTGNLNSVAGWRDLAMDQMLDQARSATDVDERREIYYDVQEMLAEESPWVWLYKGEIYHAGQPYVEAFTPLSNRSLRYLRETWLNR